MSVKHKQDIVSTNETNILLNLVTKALPSSDPLPHFPMVHICYEALRALEFTALTQAMPASMNFYLDTKVSDQKHLRVKKYILKRDK